MRRLLLFLLCIGLFACSKDGDASTLTGSWELKYIFSNATAGCGCWQNVTPTNVQTLRLERSGTFSITYPPISSVSGCAGKYRVISENILALTSNCRSLQDTTVQHQYERKGDTLIIDFPVQTQLVRYKYVRI